MSESRVAFLREELIFLLNQATELEHSLSCSYLFTAFSLKDSLEEGLSEDTLERVRRWKRVFNGIAIDEMMHLAIVNNLLVALGAAPHFDRPNFPHDTAYYMPGLIIQLQAFSEPTLRHYIAIEQPLGSDIPFPEAAATPTPIEGDLDNEIGPDPHALVSQGDLYSMIANGVGALVSRLGEENVFIGPPPRQPFRTFLESSGWKPVTNRQSTLRALAQIVEQGEGASGDNPDSHFWKFQGILREYQALKEKDPGFEPVRPLLANPFARTPPEAQGAVNLIDDAFAIQVSDLFNEAYGVLLQLLGRFFALTEETDEEATLLADAAIEVMTDAILPLGELLVRLPAGVAHAGLRAGPSFVVRTMHVLPYKTSAWRLLKERCEELSEYTGDLASAGGSAAALLPVKETFARIAQKLV